MPIHKTSIPEILIPAGNCLASFLDANLWQRCDVNKSVCLAQTLLAAITSMTIGSNMSRCCCACVESNSNSVSYVLTNDLVKSLHFTLSTSTLLLIPQVTNRKKQGFHSPQNIHLTKPIHLSDKLAQDARWNFELGMQQSTPTSS